MFPSRREAVSALFFVALSLVLGLLASLTQNSSMSGMSLWPPMGLAFGYCYARGSRAVPCFVFVQFVFLLRELSKFDVTWNNYLLVLTALLLACVYGLQLFVAVKVTQFWLGPKEKLIELSKIFRFLFVAGPLHTITVPVVGSLIFYVFRCPLSPGAFEYVGHWYLRDLFGALLFSIPAVIIWAEPRSFWKPRIGTILLPMCMTFALALACYGGSRIQERHLLEETFQQDVNLLQTEIDTELRYAEIYAKRFKLLAPRSLQQARSTNNHVTQLLEQVKQDIPWSQSAGCAFFVPTDEALNYEERTNATDASTARFPIFPQSSHTQNTAPLFHVVLTATDGRFPNVVGTDLMGDSAWAKLIRMARQTRTTAIESPTSFGAGQRVKVVVPCQADSVKVDRVKAHGFVLLELNLNAMIEEKCRERSLLGSRNISAVKLPEPPEANSYELSLHLGHIEFFVQGKRSRAYEALHQPRYSVLMGLGGMMLTLMIMVLLLSSEGQTLLTNQEVIRRTTELEREMSTRKTVEASLRLSESSLLESQRLAGLGYWEWKRNVDGLYWSPILTEMLGFQGSDIRMQLEDLTTRIHPEDRERITELIQNMKGKYPPVDTEFRIQRADGSFRWFDAVISVSHHGPESGVRGTMLDVTDRKRAENALRDGEARLRIALQSAKMGTWEWVLGSDQLTWDARLQAIFGFIEGTFDRTMNSFLARIHPLDRQRVEQSMRTIQDSGESFSDEFQIVWPSGEIRWVAGYGHPLSDRPGMRPRYVGIYLDITERKRNELALRESEARRRLALDAGGMGTMIWEVNADRMSWDQKLHALFGVTLGEFEGTLSAFLRRVQAVDRQDVHLRIRDLVTKDGDESCHVEFRTQLKNGTLRWLTGHAHVLYDGDGKAFRVVGIFFDSTERKVNEEALRAGREMLKRAQSLARIGSFDWSPKTDQTFWSDEMYRILGYEPNSVAPTYENLIARVHPDDRALIATKMAATLEQDLPYDFEFRVLKPTGEVRYLAVQAELTRNAEGEPLKFRGVNQDVTERRLFEQQLKESEARLNEAQRIARTGSWHWHIERDEVMPSAALMEICGFTPGEPLNSIRFFEWIHPDDLAMVKAQLTDAVAQWQRFTYETRFFRGGTVERWFKIVGQPDSTNLGNRAMIGSIQDITEAKQEEEQRRKFNDSLQQTQRLESLGVLAGGVAHDFNNLLTGILGNASLARELLPSESEIQEFLRPIEKSAIHAAELCQQMLVYAGKGSSTRGPVELSNLVRDSLDLLKLAASRKAKLVIDLSDELPMLEGDIGRLRQVLLNLVQNASESLLAHGGTITVRTGFSDELYVPCDNTIVSGQPLTTQTVWLEVADTGTGMPPETMARIFEPFFTTKFTGRGLGLSAVHGIVRDHQGCLAVTSGKGRGTCFRIMLPTATAHLQENTQLTDTPPPISWQSTQTRRAFVIDDEPTIRGIAGFALRSLGFTAEESGDGNEAITRFREQPGQFSLILLDLALPTSSGYDVLEAIRALRPDLPVILMSGYSEGDPEAYLRDPYTSFLAKPFRAADLTSTVRRTMNTSLSFA